MQLEKRSLRVLWDGFATRFDELFSMVFLEILFFSCGIG